MAEPWRPIRISIWDWLEDLDPLAQRLYLWLATSRESSPTGLLRLREYRAAGALRTKPAALRAALLTLQTAGKVVTGSRGDGWVDLYLTSWLTSQCAVNQGGRSASLTAIKAFTDGAAKSQAIEDWALWDAACRKADRRLGAGSRQQEQEQEQEQNKSKPPIPPKSPSAPGLPGIAAPEGKGNGKRAKTVAQQPPDEAEVAAYMADRGAPDAIARREAAKFVGHYGGKGWKVGKQAMTDWHKSVAGWLARERERNPALDRAMDSTRTAVVGVTSERDREAARLKAEAEQTALDDEQRAGEIEFYGSIQTERLKPQTAASEAA